MGSGCTKSNVSNQCADPISDRCVLYTGEAIPVLGICTGDRLDEIEEVILNKLLEYAEGEGITLSEITGKCPFVTQFLVNSDKSLHSLIQGLFDNDCTLRQLITDLENGVEPPFSFDTKCLTVPTSANRNQIIQANINKTCELNTKVNDIIDQIGEITSQLGEDDEGGINDAIQEIVGNTLLDSISACQQHIIQKTGAGKNAKLSFIGLPPPGTMLFGVYNIADFDSTGKGLASRGMCGWNVANGLNNTVDMRGFTAAGATNGIPGPALKSQVQGLSVSMNTRAGHNNVTLNSSQLPDHEHEVTQQPHSHTYEGSDYGKHPAGGTNDEARGQRNKQTSSSVIDLQVKGLKGAFGQPVDVRQPTFYAMWIQRPFVAALPSAIPGIGVAPGVNISVTTE